MKKTILASMLAVMMATPAFAAESTDIVIIGSGGAGLSSAITATEKGAKVIVLEKMAYFGGNSNRSEGEMNAAGTKQQKDHGITDDTPERFAADTIRGGHGLNDPALVKALTENAASAEEWLLDLGAHFCHRMGRGGGQTRARGHGPCDGSPVGIEIMRVLGERADKDHIDMRLNNRVTKILMKNGKVSGVQVKTPKGMETINAKAVILATGGFGANHKMVEKYRPELKGFSTTNHPGATGDGIILAQQVGAGLTDIEQIQIHPTVIKKNGALISESMRARGGFLLNKNGKRFTNELLTRDVVSANELKQPGGIAYLVFGYAIVATVLKACQPMLLRRMYDWYYGRFSLIALPALAMFWTGVGYRVQQYGFTQDRVYLAVCGAIMTVTILLFFSRRSGRYLYVAALSGVLLAVFTYIPGVTAAAIGIRSQMQRAERIVVRLGLADASGRLILQKRPDADSIYREDYRRLYESFEYLARNCPAGFMAERYGVDDSFALQNEVIPQVLEWYVSVPWATELTPQEDPQRNSVLLESDGAPVDISGYRTLRAVQNYENGQRLYADLSRDTLSIKDNDGSLLFRRGLEDMLREKLSGSGYAVRDTVPVAALDSMKSALLQYETDSVKVVFDMVRLSRFPELRIEYVSVGFFLEK